MIFQNLFNTKKKSLKRKEESVFTVEKIDATKVKYICPKCKYNFVYDTERQHPGRCPYCAHDIVKFVVVEPKPQ